MDKTLNELDNKILETLFGYRYSRTVLMRIFNECNVCHRKLEDEYFEEHDMKRLNQDCGRVVDDIKELVEAEREALQELVKEAMPKKKEDETNSDEYEYNLGFNQAIEDISKALKEKGLL